MRSISDHFFFLSPFCPLWITVIEINDSVSPKIECQSEEAAQVIYTEHRFFKCMYKAK